MGLYVGIGCLHIIAATVQCDCSCYCYGIEVLQPVVYRMLTNCQNGKEILLYEKMARVGHVAFAVYCYISFIFRDFCLVEKRNLLNLHTEKGFAPISKPEYIKINKLKKIRNALKLNQISFALRKK